MQLSSDFTYLSFQLVATKLVSTCLLNLALPHTGKRIFGAKFVYLFVSIWLFALYFTMLLIFRFYTQLYTLYSIIHNVLLIEICYTMLLNLSFIFIKRSQVKSKNMMEASNMEACSTCRQRETQKCIPRGANDGLLNHQTYLEDDKIHVQNTFPKIGSIITSMTLTQMFSVNHFHCVLHC